ncbi:hypothetical protein BGZ63DRAFT_442671 [Mariannaea sp. PMI_226]|nr:hypothetical protein BGZ63DRAFT_442671 [Mariannaea sp. PMI_226]
MAIPTSTTGRTLLLFGSQIPRISADAMKELRRTIFRDSKLEFLLGILQHLPTRWDTTCLNHAPFEYLTDAKTHLQQLTEFFETEAADVPFNILSCNLTLAPLTVILHMVEYMSLGLQGNVQGFCVGFLSAAAVASSRDVSELERWVAVAVNLAVCIGAVIDLDEQQQAQGSSAFSIRWTSTATKEHLQRTIDAFPGVYMSCLTDVDRATVTVPADQSAIFQQRLADGGLSANKIGISGRYHQSSRECAEVVRQIKSLCLHNKALQFPAAEQLVLPLRSTSDTNIIARGLLHDVALDSILMDVCHWYETVQATIDSFNGQPVKVIPISNGLSITPRALNIATAETESLRLSYQDLLQIDYSPTENRATPPSTAADDIPGLEFTRTTSPVAVIGMACRFAQAESVDQFWSLLKSGRNTVSPVPAGRFRTEDISRNPKGPFWGNFIQDPDKFDHRFFGISARMAASMDPQQRVLLQVAYEAIESAGYADGLEQPNRPVGCYVGAGYVEYEDNVASEDATAFSATGTLRAFLSGRISHQFGWTGPSVVVDTACSSSTVAIHHACKALETNDCSVAVACGVSIITSATLYQNLAAASFLSPTGASRAFDADADGYCRGEGAGVLVLKPLAQALANKDRILGTIMGSAVNQNMNDDSITVPNSKSQSDLYHRALTTAGVLPCQVSYVEAHGTGTPIGDPIEYHSIRQTFGNPDRADELIIGSVKDVIGHTEAASGMAGVIKTLLMMRHATIPRQPNFRRLSPRITAIAHEKLSIATRTRPWHAGAQRIALVNNYGAAGSNAAIVLQEHDSQSATTLRDALQDLDGAEYPFLISAKTRESLHQTPSVRLHDVACNMARKQNQTLDLLLTWTAKSLLELRGTLEAIASERLEPTQQCAGRKRSLPVVMCFGGQNGQSIYMSQDIVQGSASLRGHLYRCDEICRGFGLPSLFPSIFDPAPLDDMVLLHACLFSAQYSSAMAWLDSGLQVAAVIGHSFGQLTALCVAGSVNLADAFRLVIGRASLFATLSDNEPGMMLAVEGNPECVISMLKKVCEMGKIDVACYNGPRNIVVAGAVPAVKAAEHVCRQAFPDLKMVRLANTQAYHSHLVDPILESLNDIAKSITFRKPSIPIETCSTLQSWTTIDAAKLVQHTREPVFFGEAVERIAVKYPSCIWLEATAASPLVRMVSRALPDTRNDDMLLSPGRTWSDMAKTITKLWASGLKLDISALYGFKAHHYQWLDLPSYQFAKTSHWLQFRPATSPSTLVNSSESNPVLVRRLASEHDKILFSVSALHDAFKLSVNGHAVFGQALCPASFYVEMATRAVSTLLVGQAGAWVPHIEHMHIKAPLGLQQDRLVFIALSQNESCKWTFLVFSRFSNGLTERTAHAEGAVSLMLPDDSTSLLGSIERVLRVSQFDQSSSLNTNQLSGEVVYKIFQSIVNYAPYYRGLRNVITKNEEVIGEVVMPQDEETVRLTASCLSNPLAVDNVLQAAGIHINYLHAAVNNEDGVYVCNAFGDILFSRGFLERDHSLASKGWRVHSFAESRGKTTMVCDIFAWDPVTSTVALRILGAEFSYVTSANLRKILGKINQGPAVIDGNSGDAHQATARPLSSETGQHDQSYASGSLPSSIPAAAKSPAPNVYHSVQRMLADIFGMDIEQLLPDMSLASLGLDSLMATEISGEIQKRFQFNPSTEDVQSLTDIQSLVSFIHGQADRSLSPSPHPVAPMPVNNMIATSHGVNNGTEDEEDEDVDDGVAAIGSEWHNANWDRFDEAVQESGFANFYRLVYPFQAQLVVAYVVDALTELGCPLHALGPGERLPDPVHIYKHDKLIAQIYRILEDAGLITTSKTSTAIRTEKPVPHVSAQELHEAIVQRFPQHAGEHQLLHTTGACLASCLTGKTEPLSLLFGNAKAKQLMEEVYTNAPMFRAGTLFLTRFLISVCTNFKANRSIRILELGAGTGGTTQYLAEQLQNGPLGCKVSYTFSDISPSLVAAARRKFAKYSFIDYITLDVDKEPDGQHREQYDIIISTNCIHATANLVRSCTNVQHMLRKDGLLCLVELTQGLFWFDLVFGLLEGWWLFNDGRVHALVSEMKWKETLQQSGFPWVTWSEGESAESKTLRVITASKSKMPRSEGRNYSHQKFHETVVFKRIGSLCLNADIYYPRTLQTLDEARPIALMIHGGGHVMLSRKDVRLDQAQILLDMGFIPISVDYRLCPETSLVDGPMTDVRDALNWARNTLPSLARKRSDVRLSGDRVVAVGWSTGGHLAMSLGWTAPAIGLKPPQAVLAFYCPTDYEDTWWSQPNRPFGLPAMATEDYNLWDGVAEVPIAAYCPKQAIGGWMSESDARSRILLHMNWHGQTLPILTNGLIRKEKASHGTRCILPQPAATEVQDISPLFQIQKGNYHTPTFLVHPIDDDLIPWQQAQRTADELSRKGVVADVRIVDGSGHLFDMHPSHWGNSDAGRAIADGYMFLLRHTV